MEQTDLNGLASLARKKAAIMGDLQKFAKDKKNAKQGYGYASAETIFDTIRGLMNQHGLVLFTSAVSGNQEHFESKGGTPGLHTTVQYRMLWVDTDTGATVEDYWLSEGDDYQDKGYSKCATLALKYYLLTTFIVSSGDASDDPDSGLRSKSNRQYQQKPPQRPAATPKTGDSNGKGATNGHKTPEKTQDAPFIENGTVEQTTVKTVEIVDKDGQRRLKLHCDDDVVALAFSRQMFIERGWIEDTEWKNLGSHKLKNRIPIDRTYRHVIDEHGEIKGGYWEMTAVGEVIF